MKDKPIDSSKKPDSSSPSARAANAQRPYERGEPKPNLPWEETKPAPKIAGQKPPLKHPPNNSVDTYGSPPPL